MILSQKAWMELRAFRALAEAGACGVPEVCLPCGLQRCTGSAVAIGSEHVRERKSRSDAMCAPSRIRTCGLGLADTEALRALARPWPGGAA